MRSGTLWTDDRGRQWRIEFTFAFVNDRIEPVSFEMRPSGTPFTVEGAKREVTVSQTVMRATLLRSVPFGKLQRQALRELSKLVARDRRPSRDEDLSPPSLGRPPTSFEKLEEAVRVYEKAEAERVSPINAVARRFRVSKSQANRYMKSARDLGLLQYQTEPPSLDERRPV